MVTPIPPFKTLITEQKSNRFHFLRLWHDLASSQAHDLPVGKQVFYQANNPGTKPVYILIIKYYY